MKIRLRSFFKEQPSDVGLNIEQDFRVYRKPQRITVVT